MSPLPQDVSAARGSAIRLAVVPVSLVESIGVLTGEKVRKGPARYETLESRNLLVEPITRVRMELRHLKPKIWRRVDVPLSSTLMSLHHIIQAAMGWTGSHLFEFTVRGLSYGDLDREADFADWEVLDARKVKLQDLIGWGIKRFTYTYDFGDDWRHMISLGKPRVGKADIDYPAFVGGARRCPPEDVGGFAGFEQFLEAVQDPTHQDNEDLTDWHESLYLRNFDPDDISEDYIRSQLARISEGRR